MDPRPQCCKDACARECGNFQNPFRRYCFDYFLPLEKQSTYVRTEVEPVSRLPDSRPVSKTKVAAKPSSQGGQSYPLEEITHHKKKAKKSKGEKRTKHKHKHKHKNKRKHKHNEDHLPNVINHPSSDDHGIKPQVNRPTRNKSKNPDKKPFIERLKDLWERNNPFKFLKNLDFGSHSQFENHRSSFRQESFHQTSFMYTRSDEPEIMETYTQSND